MADTLVLEVATPERLMLEQQVTEAEVPAAGGALGILPEHAPLLAELGTGELSYTAPGSPRRHMAVSDGWVEVLPNRIRVLALRAEFGDEIDVERARRSLKRAEDRLATPMENLDVARALNAARRARVRLVCAAHSVAAKR
ncbi:MAG: ATP synthase F1 subunit epsilon [Burkholderiales bacterium]|nr:ATP synthase F1 subunit epsilon [Burkholderiales bacterium]